MASYGIRKAHRCLIKLRRPLKLKVFAMVVNSEDLGPAREMAIFRRIKYIRGGVLIVALVRPPPDPGMPKSIQGFPHKTLMNLVSDLCQTR